jgi:hypothetical protein
MGRGTASPRVLMVAPFERDLHHGGSQRATALAERLEERGFEVEWETLTAAPTTSSTRVRAAVRLRPNGVLLYPRTRRDDVDVAIAAHSYLAPALDTLPASTVRIVDFHNLEWAHLADSAEHAHGARRMYLNIQSALMRRFERGVIASSPISLFTCTDELDWARPNASDTDELMVVPSLLPRAVAEQALGVDGAFGGDGEAKLAYVGTVRFPPNLGALTAFLETVWPAARAAVPNLKLTIAGAADDQTLASLRAHPGVEALGFVEDTTPLLQRSAAAIMPITGRAGTSLRALYYALSGVAVIGSPAAFRGLDWSAGTVVESTEEWVRAIEQAVAGGYARTAEIAAARAAASALQEDPRPFDLLAEHIGAHLGNGARG